MIEVRDTAPDDWRDWRVVRLRALEEAPYAFGSKLADWQGDGDLEQRWRSRLTTVPKNVIAWLDGSPVGQAGGMHTDVQGRPELISMWVAPEARGTGAGDGLIQAIRQWAIDDGAHSLALWVKVDNRAAIGLYERQGFVRSAAPVVDGEFEMIQTLV